MSTAKLRIDLSQGIIEAEGTEEFVSSIYSDFKDKLALKAPDIPEKSVSATPPSSPKRRTSSAKSKASSKPKTANHKSSSTPTLLKDLDLKGGENENLKDFYSKYSPKNNMEKNLVFAYYLEHEVGETPITLDHIFTCYRHMKFKVPKALHQSLVDTARRNGWLDTSSMNDIKVPISGMNHIEHDMEKS